MILECGAPGGAIEGAVRDGFADVAGEDVGAGMEVGDGAGYAEDAVVGAGRHVVAVHGGAEKAHGIVIEGTVLAQHLTGHLGVAVDAGDVFEAFGLDGAGGDDTLADGGGGLAGRTLAELVERYGLYLALYIDAVEQRAGDAVFVLGHGAGRARAGAGRVGIIAAWTGVHRGHEHEAGGVFDGVFCSRHQNFSVLERLSQHLKDLSVEFGELVEMEHPVVRKGDFARHGVGAATDEGDGRDSVVRCAEGARGHQHGAAAQFACHGVDFRRLQRLGECQRR